MIWMFCVVELRRAWDENNRDAEASFRSQESENRSWLSCRSIIAADWDNCDPWFGRHTRDGFVLSGDSYTCTAGDKLRAGRGVARAKPCGTARPAGRNGAARGRGGG
jgi:hypothetical protein